MKIIGITGGVGSGKSAILSYLKDKYNCIVFLADDAAKELEKKGNVCYDRLVDLLGKKILNEDEEIDSKKMAAAIFEDDKLLEAVNGIIHPAVKIYILDSIKKAHTEGYDYFFLEAALLIECGYNSIVDEMWYVFAEEKIRRKRLKESRGYSDEKIDSIMNSQLSEEEYRNNSDFVIDNSKTLKNSLRQIDKRLS